MQSKEPVIWRLGPYIIVPLGKGWEWQTNDFVAGDGLVMRRSGEAIVDRHSDVTWLSGCRAACELPALFKPSGVAFCVARLPVWTKTRWACQWEDDCGSVALIDCRTGKLVNEQAEYNARLVRALKRRSLDGQLKQPVTRQLSVKRAQFEQSLRTGLASAQMRS
jgi:hypothetical protein